MYFFIGLQRFGASVLFLRKSDNFLRLVSCKPSGILFNLCSPLNPFNFGGAILLAYFRFISVELRVKLLAAVVFRFTTKKLCVPFLLYERVCLCGSFQIVHSTLVRLPQTFRERCCFCRFYSKFCEFFSLLLILWNATTLLFCHYFMDLVLCVWQWNGIPLVFQFALRVGGISFPFALRVFIGSVATCALPSSSFIISLN